MTMKPSKDEIDLFLEHGISFESRIILIGSPDNSDEEIHSVTFHTASSIIKGILLLEQASSDPITIFLSTFGGDFYSALAIYDVIVACRCKVIIKGIGTVQSAGAIIMQAASEGCRLLYPETTVMIHDGEDGYHGHPRDLERWADQSKFLRNRVYQIFAARCNEKVDFFRKKHERDWILTASKAVEYNIADAIVETNFDE